MMFAPQTSMLDWFRDQERRLQDWRDELASKGAAGDVELGWLDRHRAWLRGEIERLSRRDSAAATRTRTDWLGR